MIFFHYSLSLLFVWSIKDLYTSFQTIIGKICLPLKGLTRIFQSPVTTFNISTATKKGILHVAE